MFTNHPKGLYALALANTGERFGYYTMLAIFVLFLQAKFGLSSQMTGQIFGGFMAAVYFLPLLGGIIADNWLGYGKTITAGIVIMFGGYLLLAVPGLSMPLLVAALFTIALGTGLFKGNLQVLVGNLYDDPKYQQRRDPGFSLFYMAINIGAMFAPAAASSVTDYFMAKGGLFYNPQIPALAHQFLRGTITPEGAGDLAMLAAAQPVAIGDLTVFCRTYIDRLSESYHYGFGVACISLVGSMIIYLSTRRLYRQADFNSKQLAAQGEKTVAETKPTPGQTGKRITALCLVFAVVIFFWMSFHQNGLTMTWFARDYTAGTASGPARYLFNVFTLTFVCVGIYALFGFFQARERRGKIISLLTLAASVVCAVVISLSMEATISVKPELFQQFNPFFVVALTPVSIALFGRMAKGGKEPSTPRKIGVGMFVAAAGFLILAVVSFGLAGPAELEAAGGVSPVSVSPNWLINTYLVLTFAELLLSPMGISFVTKVAPARFKGLMMGGWFAATAIGNYLTFIPASLWESGLPLWAVWGVLIALCLLSAVFIFAIMRRLEAVTGYESQTSA
jgi:POT family proton-dependent oligopeptide transporter